MDPQQKQFNRIGMPIAKPGQVIGLLGGSFDPPHLGHVHITKHALRRFGLHQVWWLVSPGNPLKSAGPAPINRRITAAKKLFEHPKVKITDLETRLGTRYTDATLKALTHRYRGTRFVWLMGADNLAEFHRWNNWRWIMEHFPIGVLARPGDRAQARNSVAANQFAFAQLQGRSSQLLARASVPCWCFVNVPMIDLSSTAIRESGDWKP